MFSLQLRNFRDYFKAVAGFTAQNHGKENACITVRFLHKRGHSVPIRLYYKTLPKVGGVLCGGMYIFCPLEPTNADEYLSHPESVIIPSIFTASPLS